jgi:hypothetical protein
MFSILFCKECSKVVLSTSDFIKDTNGDIYHSICHAKKTLTPQGAPTAKLQTLMENNIVSLNLRFATSANQFMRAYINDRVTPQMTPVVYMCYLMLQEHHTKTFMAYNTKQINSSNSNSQQTLASKRSQIYPYIPQSKYYNT